MRNNRMSDRVTINNVAAGEAALLANDGIKQIAAESDRCWEVTLDPDEYDDVMKSLGRLDRTILLRRSQGAHS